MTCLCLTRNRREWLPKAIRCYQGQTYPNRELLVLADGESVRDLIPDDPSIRLLELPGSPEIGNKRNLGCSRALGEIIIHWDDDDHSEKERIADQVARLTESRLAVTGYRSMRFTDGQSWWRYSGAEHHALGTSLCYRRDWWKAYPFSSEHVGEDVSFTAVAFGARQLVTADAGDLMHATIHPGNTSPRQLTGSYWKRIS